PVGGGDVPPARGAPPAAAAAQGAPRVPRPPTAGSAPTSRSRGRWGVTSPPRGVTSPGGSPGGTGRPPPPTANFPCHRWLESGDLELREGTARTPQEAARVPELLQQRQEERKERRETFQWAPYAPGVAVVPPGAAPHPVPVAPPTAGTPDDVTARDVTAGVAHRGVPAPPQIRIRLRGLRSGGSWSSFRDVEEALEGPGTPISAPRRAEYVVQHWQEDAFFGEQFLSGVNPVLLRRCPRLPPNFPVTPHMVAPSLGPHTCLRTEMEGGRVFLADYALLEGLPTGRIGGEPQFVAAPLCLLWLSPRGRLLPVAIQLSQTPGPDSPIFLPGCPGWSLAKLWVRGAHFLLHEMVPHLLHGHFLGEAFAVATQRLPAAHPVHQLLLPHLRFTFHINILARDTLLNPGGIIDQATSIGREGTLALVARGTLRGVLVTLRVLVTPGPRPSAGRGTLELVARGTAALTYSELCVPDDVERRGVAQIPGYHYRDDALDIWGGHPRGIVGLFYGGDGAVAEDEELQDWVGEIFTFGVLGNKDTGFPSRLCSRAELSKFLTMIIFCCSARHAAVNSGQYDYAAWMPNTPGTLRRPPPRSGAEATPELFLGSLPSPEATGALLALLSVVSYEGGEQRPLGSRCPELLVGEAPRALLGQFRRRLDGISRRVRARNARLDLPYPYLDPPCVQESVSI
ncbi:hydroperoxide isomerase ALOXE3-like, partial [Manacus candei]|uniref:hydroperoxide isomerase ALOXE3-like n=1 Tax=Manacus candei TaxID=415023 RepID=UPI002226EAD3